MYKVKAQIDLTDADRILDELVELFEVRDEDCTCGIIRDVVVGYVEEDMLSSVTATLLRYAAQVNVQMVEDEELVLA
jgi:hypothetical protein